MQYVAALLLGICTLAPRPAAAQSGISIELPGSVVAPVGKFVQPLVANGTSGSQIWTVEDCALPAGLAIRTDYFEGWFPPGTSAALAGVVTEPSSTTCTVRVTDSIGGTATATLSLSFGRLRITTPRDLPDANPNEFYSLTLATSGAGEGLWFEVEDPLPPGLSLNTVTGEISGTVPQGEYDFSIRAHSPGAADMRWFHLRSTPLHFTNSLELKTRRDVPFTHTFTVEGGTPPYVFESGCCMVDGLWFDNSNGTLSGTPVNEWSRSFNVRVHDAAGAWLERNVTVHVVTNPPMLPMITSGELEDVTVGESFSAGVWPEFGTPPFTLTVTEPLPDGVSLFTNAQLSFVKPGSPQIAGIPGSVGGVTVDWSATDSGSPAMQANGTTQFRVSGLWLEGPPWGQLNAPYSHQLKVLGGKGAYSFSILHGSFPKGLTLDESGLLHGTPVETGNRDAWVEVSDESGQKLKKHLNVFVGSGGAETLNVNPDAIGPCTLGDNYGAGFGGNGGSGTYTWTLAGGEVPPGLTLDLSGNWPFLGGQCTVAGNYTFMLRAEDTANPSSFGLREYTVRVSALRIDTPRNLPFANAGSAYSLQLSASGATGAVTFELKPGDVLPAGLSLNGSTISGTPNALGRYTFSLIATDTGGGYAEGWFALEIYPEGMIPPVRIETGPDLGTWSRTARENELRASGGTGDYRWTLESGSLPDGIVIRHDKPPYFSHDASAGLIGVPTTAGTYDFTLRATSGTQYATQAFHVKVTRLHIRDAYIPEAFVGVPYEYTLTAVEAAGPVTWSVNENLPPGLQLDAATGRIWGTPTAEGTYNPGFGVSDGVDSSGWGYQLEVHSVRISGPDVLPNATQDSSYSFTLTAEGGSGAITWSLDGGMPYGMSLKPDGTIWGTPSQAGTWCFDVTATDEARRFHRKTVSLTVIGTPAVLLSIRNGSDFDDISLGDTTVMDFRAEGGTAPYTWTITGAPPAFTVRTSAGRAELSGRAIEPGVYDMTVSVTDSSTPPLTTSQTYRVRVVPMALDWSTIMREGTRGQPYYVLLRVIGGSLGTAPPPPWYTFAIDKGELPAGLSLDPASGVISGTPLENTNRWVRFRITDANGNALLRGWNFDIGASDSTVRIDDNYDLGWATLDQFYSRNLGAGGAPSYVWRFVSGDMPPGLILSAGGNLSGTPTTAGTFRFIVRAEDSANSANYGTRQFVLRVTPISVNVQADSWGNAGSKYTATFTATGAANPVTWALDNGSLLPPGLTLGADGVVSGTPESAGRYCFNVTATETGTEHTQTRGICVDLYPAGGGPPLQFDTNSNLGWVGAHAFFMELRAQGGKPPYTFTYTPGATEIPGTRVQNGEPLPDWHSPDATAGVIGFIPFNADQHTLTVYRTRLRVTDSAGNTFDKDFTLNASPLARFYRDEFPRAAVGVPYLYAMHAENGIEPYIWSAPSQGEPLPPGLTLSSDGFLSGTPTNAGQFRSFICVTAAEGSSACASDNLTVFPFAITTPGVLPEATVNVPYSVTFETSGGTPPFTWELQGGTPGMTFDTSTGTLQGTPGQEVSWQVFVRVRDANNATSEKMFLLRVASNPRTPMRIETGADLGEVTVGRSDWELHTLGGVPPFTWALEPGSSLPPGLGLFNDIDYSAHNTPGWSVLGGEAVVPGHYDFTLRVTDAEGSSLTRTFSLTVVAMTQWYRDLPVANHSPLVYASAYSQPLLAAGGASEYTWTALDPLPAGLTLSSAGTVEGTPLETGSYDVRVRVTDTEAGGGTENVRVFVSSGTPATLEFGDDRELGSASVNAPYSRQLSIYGSPEPSPNYALALAPGSTLPAGIAIDGSRLVGTPQEAGTFHFRLEARDASGNLGVRVFTLVVTPFTIYNQNLPDASTEQAYSQELIAFGSETPIWSVAPGSYLPAGMNIVDGVLKGTPAAAGDYSFQLQVSDGSAPPATRTFSLHVSPIAITSPTVLPAAVANAPYSYRLTAIGGGESKTWSLDGGGPAISSSGMISGNFGPGLVTFRARVSDGTNTAVKQFVIPVAQDHPPIMSVSMDAARLPDATVNVRYEQQLQVDGGTPPYTWSVASGSNLPSGLWLLDGSLMPTDRQPGTFWLAGIPTVVRPNTFVLEITDGAGAVLRRTFSLNVSPLRLRVSPDVIPFHTASTVMLSADGGTPPYTYAIVSGDLPAGMTLNETTGVISGTPLATPWSGPTIQVTDAEGRTLKQPITIMIQPSPSQNPWAMGTWIWSWGGAPYGLQGGMGVWGGTPPYHWTVEPGSVPASAVFSDPNSPNAGFASISFPMREHMFLARVTDSQGNFQVAQTKWRAEAIYVPRCYAPQGRAGEPYKWQFRAYGANPPFTYSEPPVGITPLPPGLSVSPTGLVSGTIPESGRFTINVKVTDASGKWITWGGIATIVSPGQVSPLVSADVRIPDGSIGVPYHHSLNLFAQSWSTGGVPPFIWTLEPGSDLPPGLVLVPASGTTGAYLTGVPTARGDYQFVVRQTDSAGQTILRTLTMYVSAMSVPPLPPRATVNVPYSYTLAASGGEPPYSYNLNSGSVPDGMQVNDGSVTGTPSTAGAYFLNFTVTDSTGDHFSPNWYRLFVDASNNVFPNTVVTPDTLSILWYQGDPAPAPAAINISHGPNALGFTASVIGIPGASLSVTSGTTPRSTSLLLDSVALAGLSVGDHWGVVVFKVPDAGDEDDEAIPVRLTVAPRPPCTYSISPDAAGIQSAGGVGSLTVTTPPYCSWTAIPSEPWVVITSAASGAGNGTVTYTVAANSGTGERFASIAVNGSEHRVKQFGSTCGYSVSPLSISAPASGGSANVTVTASLADCTWTAASSGAWLHAPAGGSGSGAIAVTVDPNTGDGRSGSVSIAGWNVTVTQSAAACTFWLDARTAEMPAVGGSGSVGVIRSRPECSYSVVEGPSWITLTSPPDTNTVTYTVAPNSSTQARSGSLLIGGQAHRVIQSGVSCSFSVSNNNALFGSGGGTGSISIEANASACPWTASSNSSWLTITSQASGSGSYALQFSAGANPVSTARQGTLTVAGQTVTVNQSGVACSYTLRSTGGEVPSSGGFSSVGVLAPVGCGWTASTAADWIVITQPSGSSSGEVAFEALPNTSPAPRTGSIAVQDRVYTLTQSGVPCSYAISPASATHADNAGTGSFNYTPGAEGCPAAPVSYNDWIAVTSAGGGTVSYTVAANPTPGIRTGRIRLGDRIFTVVQTAGVCSWNLNVYGAVYSSSGGGGDVLASPSQAGCSPPPVGSSPEIKLAALSGPQAGIYTQPYTVPVFNSLVTWIRLLYIDVGGRLFTVKQTSW